MSKDKDLRIKELEEELKLFKETLNSTTDGPAKYIANKALKLAVGSFDEQLKDYLDEYLDKHDKKIEKLFNSEGDRIAKELNDNFKAYCAYFKKEVEDLLEKQM